MDPTGSIRHRRRATLVGAGAIGLWSSFALLTALTAGLPPLQTLALCFGVSGVAGLILMALRGRRACAALWPGAGALGLGVSAFLVYHALYFFALKRAPVVEASLINYLWPVLIVLFAALVPGARLRAVHLVGVGLGFLAAGLLVTRGRAPDFSRAHLLGHAAALGAALTWAGYSVLNRRHHQVPSGAMATVCLCVALLGGLAHVLLEPTVTPTARQWVALGLIGLGPMGVSFWLWDHGTKHGDVAVLGILSFATPLLSTVLLVAAGQAQLHWTQPVAIALIAVGGLIGLGSLRR
jgi:drug/metabolite transporter (DMT)-like permease